MMFFNDFIQRRLATLLQPWLRGDHELELKLGFLCSNGTLSDVSFNTSALNELLDDPSKYCFKEATVEHVNLRFSPFSSAALTLVVRGVRVILSLGEEEDEGGLKWRRKPRDTTVEEKNNALEYIDPEGCALHSAIKKITDISPRTWRTSLLTALTRHCHLELHDVHVLLQSPFLHDTSSCSLYMKKFGAGSQILGHRSFIRGFMSSLSLPFVESSFVVDIDSVQATLNSENCINTIFPASNMSALVKSNSHQSISFSFHVPAFNFLFSPADLSAILLLYGLLSKEYRCTRTGRQLWNIVATKISCLLPASNFRLIKVVRNVCLWLRYITAYQSILLQVGYPADEKMRSSATLMFYDTRYSKSMRSQWKLIAEIENDLPAEAIAAAWRIIRYRMMSSCPGEKSDSDNLWTTWPFSKLCKLLLLILSMISSLLVSFARILFLHKVLSVFHGSSLRCASVCENSVLQQSITLKFQEISLSFSPDNFIQPYINGKAVSDLGISYRDLLSFKFSIDAFFLRYLVNISEQHVTFASGPLEVLSFSIGEAGPTNHSQKNQKKATDIRQTVIWAEPAQVTYFPEVASCNATDDIAQTSTPKLNSILGKLWLNWKHSSEGENIPNVHDPWILCEMSSCLIGNGISDSSFQVKCSLVVGKLNFNLDYCLLASSVVLLRHLQRALQWSLSRRDDVLHGSVITIQDSQVRHLSSRLVSYLSKIRRDIIRMLPVKHVQIASLITGPHVRISLSGDHFAQTTNTHDIVTQVSFDICNIELLMLPNLEDNIGLSSGNTSDCDIGPESFSLKVPEEIGISGSDNGAYSCQGQVSLYAYLKVNGLKAYCEERTKNKKHQIIVLRPTIAHLNYLRKDHHSFGSSTVAISAASHLVTTGFSCLMFLDELYAFAKMVGPLYESFTFITSGSGRDLNCEEASRETVYVESQCGPTFSVSSSLRSLATNFHVLVNSSFELKSFDMVLHNSRKSCGLETYMNMMPIDRETRRKSAINEISSYGIYVSMQQLVLEFNIKEQCMDVILNTTGFRCIIFRYLTEFAGTSDTSELKNLLCSLNFLTEASVYHSKLCFCLRNLEKVFPSESLSSTSAESSSHGDSLLAVSTQRLGDHWLFTNIVISGIYVAGCEVKDVLINDFDNFNASFSVGGQFQSISIECKGGTMLLEATAVKMFVECFTSYTHWISKFWPSVRSSDRVVLMKDISEMAPLDGYPSISHQQVQCREAMWDLLEALSISLMHLSIILVERDKSGRLQELRLEVEFHFSFEHLNTVRKLSITGSKFSLLSQFAHGNLGHKSKIIRSPSYSVVPDDSISGLKSKDSSTSLQSKDYIHSDLADGSPPITSVSKSGSCVGMSMSKPGHKNLYISSQKYILKDMQCSLAVERPVTSDQINPACSNNIWVGGGSISGFDMTISLYEINILLSAIESCSKVCGSKRTSVADSRQWFYNQEQEENIEEMVPNGTIVAIQDVDQHMYVTVRAAESGYDVAGTVHYSLVGDQALFRVNYLKPNRWRPQTQYFSLVSLYAKDNYGESLRLSCHPSSRFVDICPNNSASALWKMLPFKSDAYEDAVDLESSTSLSKRTFYLVNKKNDCAVAFIDGTLEFVSKPGNLFKWKVFDDPGPVRNIYLPNSKAGELSCPTSVPRELQGSIDGTDPQSDSNVTDVRELRTKQSLLGITITTGKVTLTIVHELSDSEEKFPLLQASIIPNQTTTQISDVKLRIMNTFEVTFCYFNAQQNSWKEFFQPLEIRSFYSQKFLVQGEENSLQGVPSHFYAKFNEVTVLLSELSLDILLFVIGKLDLAGPYAIKSSLVLANCCKVENQSGLALICQFYDNQDASISSREATTIFLRHLALANQPQEASFFSVQLVQQGFLSTSPIHISLLEAQKFAWRTRIVSSQDSRSFPGPFIVAEISKGIEDGLSIVVSPLLTIHNETDFSLELRFKRPQNEETESALLILKAGDIVDDAMTAFNAVDLSGGSRKALTSLSVGNYAFSFRPNFAEGSGDFEKSLVEWSDDLKGGKPICLSGLFDKLSYQVRKAFAVNSTKFSLGSANCVLTSEEGFVSSIYFLIQTVGKTIPVVNPDNYGYAPGNRNSPVAMQEQKEIFILPTIRVSNFLHTEMHVSLTDKVPHRTVDYDNKWSQATISCGSAVNFYANPHTFYFVVTLTSFGSSCKPVNSGDWVRKLQKQKGDVSHLDIELDFGGGKYFAMLRVSRGLKGTLEVGIFTLYTLQNGTETPLFCFSANQKPLSRGDLERYGTSVPPELGSYLPPCSFTSWFSKCHKLRFKLLEEKALEAQLDLDVLSGLTEIDLETEELFASKNIMRLAVSLRPSNSKDNQIVSLSSRYVVYNESEDVIAIRQCYVEDVEPIAINSSERKALRLNTVIGNKKVTSVVENILKKHTRSQNDSSFFIQFRLNESGLGWSGPVCVASLGRFFLKFRKSMEFPESGSDVSKENLGEFAAVHVVEEGSTIVLHFHRPPVTNLPYRIENYLRDAPLTYYQKGSEDPETLGAGVSVNYVWDDLTLPHKLVIQLDDVHLLREINLDKVRSWKPFYWSQQTRGLGFHLPLEKKPEDQKHKTYSRLIGSESARVGFEVYAEGTTRVLRICEFSDSHKVNVISGSSRKIRLRISYFSVQLLEHVKQDVDLVEPSTNSPILIARLEKINWDAMLTDQKKYSQIRVQSLSLDEKWAGAPFAAMLRRHQSEKSDANDYILHVAVVLLPTSYSVKQVKYLSIVLQPLDLNLDEETLMKIVPFWRRSLSDSSAPRQQYYFDHFEIHPIKIVASFLPGDPLYSYSSTQETLRSLLHSVIKVPAIKRKTVELNGVLVTHALITLRELTIKCAQHYSWYAMRAIYIAKGSPLLPPAFASIFDDLASSSLDVFFDPSSGLLNLPGVTMGTLKMISKFIDNKGFSGTKRYFGDLGKTLKTAGSNMLFAAVTEISDSILKGAETNGFNGMVNGFHQGILKLSMEPSVLGSAFMEGGPDRKIKLDRSPGVDELYIEGYLQAMLDTMYKQEYLRVRVVENQVILKNLPPSSSLIDEIMDRVKGFLASKALLKGDSSTVYSLKYIRGEREWRIGPTILTLCEHLFVSFMIRFLRKQSGKVIGRMKWKEGAKCSEENVVSGGEEQKVKIIWKWGIGKFVLSGIVAYIDGRLCRNIPHPLARRIVSGFLLSFLDQSDDETK